MDDRKVQAATDAARRRQVKRRAKRGVVASYIHEISVRHQTTGPRPAELREPAFAAVPQS
jgi:hypothetical protein